MASLDLNELTIWGMNKMAGTLQQHFLMRFLDWNWFYFDWTFTEVWEYPINNMSALVQVMAWCCQATSHYMNQYWSRSVMPYCITRLHWAKWITETVDEIHQFWTWSYGSQTNKSVVLYQSSHLKIHVTLNHGHRLFDMIRSSLALSKWLVA